MGETMHEQRFSKLQLELLSLYNRDISDEELIQIRDMLARFFAKRATQKANAVWDEKKWMPRRFLENIAGGHREPNESCIRYQYPFCFGLGPFFLLSDLLGFAGGFLLIGSYDRYITGI
jgi:hypothetical protein